MPKKKTSTTTTPKSFTLAKAVISRDFSHPHTKFIYLFIIVSVFLGLIIYGTKSFLDNNEPQITPVTSNKPDNELKTPDVSGVVKEQEKLDVSSKSQQEQMAHYYSLGSNYLKNGQLVKAKEALEKAALLGESAYTYSELGRVYLLMGDKEISLDFYKKSLTLHQKNPQGISAAQMNYLKQIVYELEL